MSDTSAPPIPSAQITVMLPVDVLQVVDALRGRCPRSEWIRTAIAERLDRLDREPAAQGGEA